MTEVTPDMKYVFSIYHKVWSLINVMILALECVETRLDH